MRDLHSFPDAHLRIFDRPAVPSPEAIRTVYLIGIAGTGMGSLAGLFKEAGYDVSGSDAAVYEPMRTRLKEMQIPYYEGFDATHLQPAPDLVITGNACIPTHPEAAFARENHLVQLNFPEALAHFFIRDRRSLVVTGTHGKTTTTGILTHVFRASGHDAGFLVGGVMVNSGSSYAVGSSNHFISEGDEYDSAYFDKQPKFLHYKPTTAIVTSMEFDHADIYENWAMYQEAFQDFAQLVRDTIVLCGEDEAVRNLAQHTSAKVLFYGLKANADLDYDLTATNIRAIEGGQTFDLIFKGENLGNIFLPMSGNHNLLNTLSVCGVALVEGLTFDEIRTALASFKGMKRRQEVRGIVNDVLVLDDFAHHPTAVRATIAAIRQRWPQRRLVAVFEPRSNSSRRKIFEQEYAHAFDEADAVFISAPPLRHNDDPNDFMDVNVVTSTIVSKHIPASHYPDANELLPRLLDTIKPNDAVLIMSNGSFGNIHQNLLDALGQPRLFRLNNSNRDFTKSETWGKNQFNSSFPIALCAYMESKKIAPSFIQLTPNLSTTHSEIPIENVFGLPTTSDDIFYAFESAYFPFQPFVIGTLPRTDLVIQNTQTNQQLCGLEIKLTALPDHTTHNLPDIAFGSELVIRPDTITYLACSLITMCVKYNISLKSFLSIPNNTTDWSDIEQVLAHLPTIRNDIDTLSKHLASYPQDPIVIQPIWKTKGKSAVLADNCLDVFVWSNLAFIRLFADTISPYDTPNKITRHARSLVWLYKMLKDYAISGQFNYMAIIDQLSFNTKNDKAFALNGTMTHPYMTSNNLTQPRINKHEIKNIILGGGQNLLSPERRFDAIIFNSPDLFE
jgi:UDP-N-acetylmuramate: L-alanyl-gamma-D-glutamyl-meso-diaminopimelate ligase